MFCYLSILLIKYLYLGFVHTSILIYGEPKIIKKKIEETEKIKNNNDNNKTTKKVSIGGWFIQPSNMVTLDISVPFAPRQMATAQHSSFPADGAAEVVV